jgi:transketolase
MKGFTFKQKQFTFIIASTVKGKGISFMEDKEGWHGKAIPKELYERH